MKNSIFLFSNGKISTQGLQRLSLWVVLFLFFFSVFPAQKSERDLSTESWSFSQESKPEFLPAKIPGTVITDLFYNHVIPNPFFGENEKKLQWIEEENWLYKTHFVVTKKELQHQHLVLIFQGLDTFAEVKLNGIPILSANNMFRTWKVEAKKYLKEGENTLEIHFSSAVKKGKEQAKKLPYTLPEKERVFVRKASYQFGWDFAPRFVNAGIFKPIVLQSWDVAEISQIKHQQKITENLAIIDFQIEIDAENSGNYFLNINGKKKIIGLKKGKNLTQEKIEIKNPKLWYPNGFGDAHLYHFEIQLVKDNLKIDAKNLKIGLRTLELVQEKDQVGKSFYFKVNGIPLYAKGANVVPPHVFLPETDKNLYKKWMQEAKNANMNFMRIWGGGIYPEDEFYDQADENGILIWQDFMFACAMYPGDKDFLENVKQEVIDQTHRLQNHASLAIWCGNNESDEGWKNWGWQKQFRYSKEDSATIWKDYVHLFRELIPETLDSVSLQKPIYWQSSPENGWGRNLAYQQGDVHYWGIWWGMEPFEKYREKTGRFVSEYGFQGMPPVSTFLEFTTLDSLQISSKDVLAHQKHPTGFQTIEKYMERDYKIPKKFEDFAYVSQLLQARGMKTAVEAHRQKKTYNMGTLYWQFNDVWPSISWSSLDFFGNRKATYYQFKKSFSPILLSVEETQNSYKIWVNNDQNKNVNSKLKVEINDFKGTQMYQRKIEHHLEKLSNTMILEIPKKDFSTFDLRKTLMKITWENEDKKWSSLYYFVKPKELLLEKPTLKIKIVNDHSVEISSDVLAKDVYLISKNAGNFDDNFFDLLPGEKKWVSAEFPIENLQVKTFFDVN